MKYIIAAIILMATATKTMAADRIVEENGIGGAFTTISAALSASASNDRIIIYPSSSVGIYVESITPGALQNIQMLSAIEGTKYKISGDIILGNGWSIMGADVEGTISENGGTTTGVRIINCKITPLITSQYAIIATQTSNILFIDNDSIFSGNLGCISMYRGRVSGCYLDQFVAGGSSILVNPFNSIDTTVIVGNHISFTAGSGSAGILIAGSSLSTQQYFYIGNNYIENLSSGAANSFMGIFMASVKVPAGGKNNVVNNTIKLNNFNLGGIVLSAASNAPAQAVEIRNNLFIENIPSAGAYVRLAGSFIAPRFHYNYYNGPGTAFNLSGITPDATNLGTSNSTINVDGTLIVGSDAINGGDPSSIYLDLDLTRNNAGCFGGSYSMANFNVVDNGARVLFMKTPRVIFVNQTINVNAEGVDK